MAKSLFLTHIDLNLNELQNAVIHKDYALPQTGVEGQIFFDSANGEKTLYQYNGSAWVRLVDTTYTATTDRAGLAERATDTEASAGTDTTRYITPAQMKSAIDAAVAGGMHFKGAAQANTTAGGTATTPFNPSGKAIGDQWIVIAGTGSNVELTVKTGASTTANAKIGDTVICTDASNNYWTIIPSGDEPSGTVTSVAMTAPTGLTVGGSPITSSGILELTLTSGYEIPTTAHVKNYGKIKAGSTTTSADVYNDTITFAAAGGASVAINGDTVTYTQTDQKVKQTSSSDNAELPILLQTSASHTSGNTAEAKYDTDVKVNPSTGTLTATAFAGDGSALTNLPLSNYKTKQTAVPMPSAGSYTPGNALTVVTNLTQNDNGEIENLTAKSINIPAVATATPSAVSTSGSVGSSSKWAKEDHTHAISASTIEGLLGVTTGTNPVTLAKKQVFSNPASTSSTLQGGEFTWTITHDLGTADVEVQVKTSDGTYVEVEITSATSGIVVIKMNTSASSISAAAYKAIIIG